MYVPACMESWQCSWRSLRDMAKDTTSSSSVDDDYVPADRTALARVASWSKLSKSGDPMRLPALGQPGLGRAAKQVFTLHVGMLDRKCPAGPLTGEAGSGPTQASIATLAGISVRWVKVVEAWLANPQTLKVAVLRVMKQRGKPDQKQMVMVEVPADPRGRLLPGGKRMAWKPSDGLRTWPPFIQIFGAEVIPGGGGGRRRRICAHPLFYLASPDEFKARRELPEWAEVDITKYDNGTAEEEEPTRDELMEIFRRDNELALKNGELSSPFQTDHHLGEAYE